MHEESEIIGRVVAVVLLLLVAAVSAVGLKRARLPYSVGLVIIGLALGFLVGRVPGLEVLHQLELSPEVILFVFLPTLIFESAFNLDSRLLSQNLVPVFALAAPGLLLSTGVVGGLVAWLTPLPLGPSLLFGALISATDPVAVVALFKEVGAPKRLAILVEGESLFNDATAIVLFQIILVAVVGGVFDAGVVGRGVVEFVVVFGGGLGVGGLIGYFMVRSIALADDDPLVEVALSTVVAYAAFIAADHYLGVSGVMATVGAGVVVGAYGTPRFRPPVRAFLHQFWEYAAFVANGLIFLLVGMSVTLGGLVAYLVPVCVAIGAVMIARGVAIFGLVPAVGRLPGSEPIDARFQTVLWWGGLRGAVALALAFSLPADFAYREMIGALAVGVVLFSLLTGGLTMSRLMRALGLDQPTLVERMARAQAAGAAKREALARVEEMATAGHYSHRLIKDLREQYESDAAAVECDLATLRSECHHAEVHHALWAEALTVERTAYRELLDRGFISEPVLRELELVLDLRRDELKHGRLPESMPEAVPIEVRLSGWMVALLQRLAPRSAVVRRHRLRALAARYEFDTAMLEGARRVVGQIERLAELTGDPDAAAELAEAYRRREREVISRCDEVAEHFPEFVNAVQIQAAKRIVLEAEADAIGRLAAAGGIPDTVAAQARRDVERARRGLHRQPVEALEPRPEELLLRVPFFKNLAPDDFRQVVDKLVPRPVVPNETIIRQGERGTSLFLVARGVVAVSKSDDHGPSRRIASLRAGDFFGEMAILTSKPRSATVTAVSSCQLYELGKRDVDALCGVCSDLRQSLIAAARERGLAGDED